MDETNVQGDADSLEREELSNQYAEIITSDSDWPVKLNAYLDNAIASVGMALLNSLDTIVYTTQMAQGTLMKNVIRKVNNRQRSINRLISKLADKTNVAFGNTAVINANDAIASLQPNDDLIGDLVPDEPAPISTGDVFDPPIFVCPDGTEVTDWRDCPPPPPPKPQPKPPEIPPTDPPPPPPQPLPLPTNQCWVDGNGMDWSNTDQVRALVRGGMAIAPTCFSEWETWSTAILAPLSARAEFNPLKRAVQINTFRTNSWSNDSEIPVLSIQPVSRTNLESTDLFTDEGKNYLLNKFGGPGSLYEKFGDKYNRNDYMEVCANGINEVPVQDDQDDGKLGDV